MTLVATTLDELLALAEKATPGEWTILADHDGWFKFGEGERSVQQVIDDAAYIAALSPERVIALVKVAVAASASFGSGQKWHPAISDALIGLDREMER